MNVQWNMALGDAEQREIERAVEWHETLSDVVRWGLASRPVRLIHTVVPQDEYTNDVIVRFRDGVFLVYDATWLGAVTAVVVMDHAPTPAELLESRIARGWTPTPTATRKGPQVLGYAACAYRPAA